MEVKIQNYQLGSELALHESSKFPLKVYNLALDLTKLDNEAIEYRLTFHTNSVFYQHIETEALFNMTLEMRSSLADLAFLSEPDIKLEISLKSDFLPQLIEHAANTEEAATYLLNLSQEQPDHPLLFTENWLLLSAKQTCEDGERGYRTLWDYLSPTALAQAAENGSEDPTTDALINFFKDWTSSHLSTDLEQAASELFKNLETTFTEFSNTNLSDIEKLFTEFRQETKTQWQASSLKLTLLEQVIRFFTTEDWQFTKLQGEPTLAMAFQGKQSRWNCYACVREDQQQFTFYSICPIATPIDKRTAIAEFLTRANYGMILGNFELDWDDGEIRYKTSIDVTDSTLTPALIQPIVYTNVLTMDQYLPGIQAVIDGVGAIDALRQVEVPTEAPIET
jgi:hypothetical protein